GMVLDFDLPEIGEQDEIASHGRAWVDARRRFENAFGYHTIPDTAAARLYGAGSDSRDRAPARAVSEAPHAARAAAALGTWLPAYAAEPDQRASNVFAVSARRAARGKPMLANDSHLGLGTPGPLYVVHLSVPGRVDAVGACVPGLPTIVSGRNRRVAWGITARSADVLDVYSDTLSPDGRHGRWSGVGGRPRRVGGPGPARLDRVVAAASGRLRGPREQPAGGRAARALAALRLAARPRAAHGRAARGRPPRHARRHGERPERRVLEGRRAVRAAPAALRGLAGRNARPRRPRRARHAPALGRSRPHGPGRAVALSRMVRSAAAPLGARQSSGPHRGRTRRSRARGAARPPRRARPPGARGGGGAGYGARPHAPVTRAVAVALDLGAGASGAVQARAPGDRAPVRARRRGGRRRQQHAVRGSLLAPRERRVRPRAGVPARRGPRGPGLVTGRGRSREQRRSREPARHGHAAALGQPRLRAVPHGLGADRGREGERDHARARAVRRFPRTPTRSAAPRSGRAMPLAAPATPRTRSPPPRRTGTRSRSTTRPRPCSSETAGAA